MIKRIPLYLLLAALLVLAACSTSPAPTPAQEDERQLEPTSTSSPTPVPAVDPTALISEVLTGVDGNNNFDFIELANPGVEMPFDLKGWSLWFKLSDNDNETLVYAWGEHTLVPPQGHYLLVPEGQDVGAAPDAHMSVTMIPLRGGLQLRRADQTIADSLTWGSGPLDFAEGTPAAGMKNGLALERAPGGSKGNWIDRDDNNLDFAFSTPNPQNTGSSPTPERGEGLALLISAPASVLPGGQFSYSLSVANQGSQSLSAVTVQMPLPRALEIAGTPPQVEIKAQAVFWGLAEIGETSQVILWNIGSLQSGESASTQITASAPWTYMQVQAANYSAQAEEGAGAVFGSPVRTAVEGGSIPVEALKDLVGERLVVEGTATMYTGGYYAGGGNVKFYLEDQTGGVQVWVPGGDGEVQVNIGDQVRAAGNLQVYRGALELVVEELADVEILAAAEDNPAREATKAPIGQAANDPVLAGKLVQVEGVVARNEEFSYSYELDLIDDSGQLITLYVDKQTNINVETIQSGQTYKATGILEVYDTRQQLYPRIQADFERIYPPVLTLDIEAPNTIASGEELEIRLTATNYTPDLLTGLTITATLPSKGAQFISTSEGAQIKGSQMIWVLPEVPGEGARASVTYRVKVIAEDGFLTFKNYAASAESWPDPVQGQPYYVFLGDTIPIWAIQGPGDRSPYTFKPVVTAGTVTGVFPELGGFWIQEIDTDNDPLTSAGLFINTAEFEPSVNPGNSVQVSGTVRETYQQTQVQISSPDDILILESGGPLPVSVELDPPPVESEANAYYESLEGMLVQVVEPGIAVAPTSRYGEYVLVSPKNGVDRLWQGDVEHNGLAIMVDDGSLAVHEDRSTLSYVVNSGDLVGDLIGPLAYTFGRYKIEPIAQPKVTLGGYGLVSLSPAGEDAFRIMTWNVENLFDALDPHPSDPPKPGVRVYKVSIAKVANTILAAGAPMIVGLQEVENIGILEDIAGHESLAGYDYQPLLIEGTDSRYIDNGYLVRGDIATVVNVQQHVAPEGLTSRPPLQVDVDIQSSSGPVRLTVLNNHFTSMSGGETATEPRRAAQAAWNVTLLEGILEANPEARVAIIGDLNSYLDSLPVDTLREAGLIHVFEFDHEAGWYSYIYQGASQTLDHILVTPALFDLIQRVDILHVNADFALPFSEDESPLGKSDHDPVIATFSVPE